MEKHELHTSNEMSADRTWMAQERTMMAWIRTATSMISFGFTIFKFFEDRPPNPHTPLTSRDFAMVMISAALLALLLAMIQHVAEHRELARETSRKRISIAFILSFVIAGLGIFALVAAIFRD
jgi:putative membrane protein